MSENVELLRRALNAINDRDLDTLIALSDPEVEFTTLLLQIEDDVREVGNATVAGVRGIARGAGSEAFAEQRFWQVTEWRDGRGVWWCNYLGEAEALDAAAQRE
jgi:hypothetical protein